MFAARRWSLGVIAVLAIGVFLLMEPDPPAEGSLSLTPTNYQTLINVALSDNEANDARADSAPQQQVVNGWVTRDLLHIQALELADLLDTVSQENAQSQLVAANDPRVAALLALAVLAICVIGITTEARLQGRVSLDADWNEGAELSLDGQATEEEPSVDNN